MQEPLLTLPGCHHHRPNTCQLCSRFSSTIPCVAESYTARNTNKYLSIHSATSSTRSDEPVLGS